MYKMKNEMASHILCIYSAESQKAGKDFSAVNSKIVAKIERQTECLIQTNVLQPLTRSYCVYVTLAVDFSID